MDPKIYRACRCDFMEQFKEPFFDLLYKYEVNEQECSALNFGSGVSESVIVFSSCHNISMVVAFGIQYFLSRMECCLLS